MHVHSVCNLSFRFVNLSSDTDLSAVYRTVELATGWNGRIIRTEAYFRKSHFGFHSSALRFSVVLDGVMIVIAMYTINVLHPGRLLERSVEQKPESLELAHLQSQSSS